MDFYGELFLKDRMRNRMEIVSGVIEELGFKQLVEGTIRNITKEMLEGIGKISREAFAHCTLLETIEIPESVAEIDASILTDCSSLKEVKVYRKTPPAMRYDIFDGMLPEKIYVPEESVEEYKTAQGWITYAEIIFPMVEVEED